MKNIIKYSFVALIITICTGFLASCNDEDDLGSPDRLFRPQIGETTVGGTFIKLKWDRYAGAEKYDIEISVDSFVTSLKKVEVDTTEYTFEGLDYDTRYQLRIRSIGSNIMSDYFVSTDITTSDYPTRLQIPSVEDVIDTQARISWTDVAYNTLKVYHADTLFTTITIDPSDNDAKKKIITKLLPNKSYVVKAYIDIDGKEDYQGKRSFKTAAAQIFDGDVVDLRDLSDEESLNYITKAYVDELAVLYPQGVTVVLKGGATYNIKEAIFLSSDIKFVTGLSLNGYASMAIDANFAAAPSSTVNNIKFEKIFFTEGSTKKRTDSEFGGTYLFNFNQADGNVDKLTIQDCIIKYKRGVIRQQTTCTINTLTINNCVIDSIGGYGVINNSNDNSYIKDIKVTNSTISHAQKLFVGAKKLGINSLYVENVTTCYTPAASSYLFDYNGNSIPGGVTIKSCVFGMGWNGAVHGIRSKTSSLTVDKSYCTSDLSWVVAVGATVPTAPIDDLINLNLTTTELFKNPDQIDFTVTDERIRSKVGDPRWW